MKKVLAAIALCLAACSQQDVVNRLSSQAERALVIRAAIDLHDGRTSDLASLVDPNVGSSLPAYEIKVEPLLAQVRPPYKIGYISIVKTRDGISKYFVLDGGSGQHWALIAVVLRGSSTAIKVAGINVRFFSTDPAEANAFDINRRGYLGWFFLTMMAASIAACTVALFLIWRSRWLKRRWLWSIGSLWGFVGFTVNWSTGAWGVGLTIAVLGAQATRAGPFAPWLLSFGVPIIAWLVIYRWFRRSDAHRAPFE